jgi:hypothetical protein
MNDYSNLSQLSTKPLEFGSTREVAAEDEIGNLEVLAMADSCSVWMDFYVFRLEHEVTLMVPKESILTFYLTGSD